MSWDVEELAYLRWHWGSAYRITGSGSAWTATRKDNRHVVTATSAAGLLDAIRDDYAASPVPRPDLARIGRKYGG